MKHPVKIVRRANGTLDVRCRYCKYRANVLTDAEVRHHRSEHMTNCTAYDTLLRNGEV